MLKSLFVESLQCTVVIVRRKGLRSIRITIKDNGTVKLSVPHGVSERFAMDFLDSKSDWVVERLKPRIVLREGDHIGKSHRLHFEVGPQLRATLKNLQLVVRHPASVDPLDETVQAKAVKAAEKALLLEGTSLLPQRLRTLSVQHGFSFRNCMVKKLKSHWGSCDGNKDITLNIYLMQLPWHLIDYVLLHELCHTIHPHHQESFWDTMARVAPHYKALRSELKHYPTTIKPTPY